jgi:hypothetical protein
MASKCHFPSIVVSYGDHQNLDLRLFCPTFAPYRVYLLSVPRPPASATHARWVGALTKRSPVGLDVLVEKS